MNIIFISPHFPPHFHLFTQALKSKRFTVLGIGDAPEHTLSYQVLESLNHYYYVHDMNDTQQVEQAARFFQSQYGKLDRVVSFNEHWLALEAHLRDVFDIPGPKTDICKQHRSKMGMKKIFEEAKLSVAKGGRVDAYQDLATFVKQDGFPVILKPDTGVGAANTYRIDNHEQLESFREHDLKGYTVEEFITGDIVSFDGLANAAGDILFCTSHRYSSGVMEIVNEARPVHYYSLRHIPEQLMQLGRLVVDSFQIQEDFFHIEFFEQADGRYVPLEVNFRPPGGFTTDMFNYACDFDIYAIYAAMLSGQLDSLNYERKYHVAYVGRRSQFDYRNSNADVYSTLGSSVLTAAAMPDVFSAAMGNYYFIIRHKELNALRDAIAFIEEPA